VLNEQKIRLFLSLANTLSFTETANQLFITQQAVSKHISQLETELGFPLFIRSTHNVRLTEAGERCKHFFEEEVRRFSEFIDSEREIQLRRNKSLRLGYNNWLNFGNAIGCARVRFHEIHPNIAHVPERQPPDLLQRRLREGELDIILVLRRFLQNEAGLHIVELTDFPMSIIVSKAKAGSEAEQTVEQLSRFPLLINAFASETAAETTARAKREMAVFGLTNRKITITPNRDSVYTGVETGEGIATACAFSQIPEDIAVIPTEVSDTLVCVCMETNRRKLVRQYMDILRQEFAKQENRVNECPPSDCPFLPV